MALDGVLARIPGLGGYLAQEQFDQRRALGDLSGVVTLAQAAEQARMAPLKQQMLQAQMAEMQRKAEEEKRAQTMLGDIVQRYGPRTETVRGADDEMTGTPGAVTQVQRPADLLGMGTAMLNVPGREGMGANLIATAEAAQGRRDAQVQAAQARMAELQMKIQDAQLSREQRAQAAAEQAQLRRDLAQMQIDGRRELVGFAAAMRPPPRQPQPFATEQGFMVSDGQGGFKVLRGEDGKPVMPPSIVRERGVDARAVRSELVRTARPAEETLRSYDRFFSFMETGDNAQTMQLAAQTINQLSRTGSARFKGEADKLLGTGYGGGSLDERMANFLSTVATGTPTKETQERLARLARAAGVAAANDLADIYRRAATRAQADGNDPVAVIGPPRVLGNAVITPLGEVKFFKDRATARKNAADWLAEYGSKERQ